MKRKGKRRRSRLNLGNERFGYKIEDILLMIADVLLL
jgi:hypothetical protein